MPSYKLCYFDIRGLAECSRFLFAVAKQPYDDCRLSLTFGTPGDFSTIQRPEFDAAKASGELDASLGKVPYLEVDGKKIGQSKAIERYLARELGLMGSDSVEAAQVDQLTETIRDIKDAYTKAKATSGEEEKKEAIAKFFSEGLVNFVKLAEKSLPAGPGPWLVGNKVSYADISWFLFLASPKGYFDNEEGAKAAYADCPRVKAAIEATAAIPELVQYIAARKDTPF
ncbi:hypothetical protein CYMTET_27624 [Cymbomonas tetramitiformis]|uniref:Glutathione S-transferase n=1 Tax=Cymbomonas tetramitiformis TaxID=36881 RepID=A0AAE0FPC9_9CHLO|nr:hypothetical protein CYMTET_27624 [Cymbomonas tetramitiformis]|eukprot:gene28439-35248_t